MYNRSKSRFTTFKLQKCFKVKGNKGREGKSLKIKVCNVENYVLFLGRVTLCQKYVTLNTRIKHFKGINLIMMFKLKTMLYVYI